MTGQRLIIVAFIAIAVLVSVVWAILLLSDRLSPEANVIMTAVIGGLATLSARGAGGEKP